MYENIQQVSNRMKHKIINRKRKSMYGFEKLKRFKSLLFENIARNHKIYS